MLSDKLKRLQQYIEMAEEYLETVIKRRDACDGVQASEQRGRGLGPRGLCTTEEWVARKSRRRSAAVLAKVREDSQFEYLKKLYARRVELMVEDVEARSTVEEVPQGGVSAAIRRAIKVVLVAGDELLLTSAKLSKTARALQWNEVYNDLCTLLQAEAPPGTSWLNYKEEESG